MVEERKLAVLRAIVQDYVSTQEPVGSKSLVERYQLGVSPATVRNDMAALEEEGLIAQPHTSAGRIPTDKGYRVFVDRLSAIKPLSTAERRAITTLLEGAVDLDDVVARSVRLLAQLTRQVAIVQYPTLSRSTVRHVEMVTLSSTRLLLVLILSTGRVEQRVVELPATLDDEHGRLVPPRGQPCRDGGAHRRRHREARRPARARSSKADRPVLSVVVAALVEAMSDHRSDERVMVGGTANLARFGDGFDVTIRPLLEALEEHVLLLKLLGRGQLAVGADGPDRPRGAPRGAVLDLGSGQRLRPRCRVVGHHGGAGSDPHGLPRRDGQRPGGRALPVQDPRRGMTAPMTAPMRHDGRCRRTPSLFLIPYNVSESSE